jgi:hypothetical protein
MTDLTSNLSYESHSIAHSGSQLGVGKAALAFVALGLVLLTSALFGVSPQMPEATR